MVPIPFHLSGTHSGTNYQLLHETTSQQAHRGVVCFGTLRSRVAHIVHLNHARWLSLYIRTQNQHALLIRGDL